MSRQSDRALWWISAGVSAAVVGTALAWKSDQDGETAENSPAQGKKSPRTVDRVDLKRYMGTWYEISRYPNPFEGDCAGDTAAYYSLQPDGKVKIVNTCRTRKGKTQVVYGTATVADRSSNAKLKVQFEWPFSGDYWVLILNSFYEYAVVGEPSRKYLWVLSRTPTIDKGTYQGILQQIRELGYNPAKLMLTNQSRRIHDEMPWAASERGDEGKKFAAKAKAAAG